MKHAAAEVRRRTQHANALLPCSPGASSSAVSTQANPLDTSSDMFWRRVLLSALLSGNLYPRGRIAWDQREFLLARTVRQLPYHPLHLANRPIAPVLLRVLQDRQPFTPCEVERCSRHDGRAAKISVGPDSCDPVSGEETAGETSPPLKHVDGMMTTSSNTKELQTASTTVRSGSFSSLLLRYPQPLDWYRIGRQFLDQTLAEAQKEGAVAIHPPVALLSRTLHDVLYELLRQWPFAQYALEDGDGAGPAAVRQQDVTAALDAFAALIRHAVDLRKEWLEGEPHRHERGSDYNPRTSDLPVGKEDPLRYVTPPSWARRLRKHLCDISVLHHANNDAVEGRSKAGSSSSVVALFSEFYENIVKEEERLQPAIVTSLTRDAELLQFHVTIPSRSDSGIARHLISTKTMEAFAFALPRLLRCEERVVDAAAVGGTAFDSSVGTRALKELWSRRGRHLLHQHEPCAKSAASCTVAMTRCLALPSDRLLRTLRQAACGVAFAINTAGGDARRLRVNFCIPALKSAANIASSSEHREEVVPAGFVIAVLDAMKFAAHSKATATRSLSHAELLAVEATRISLLAGMESYKITTLDSRRPAAEGVAPEQPELDFVALPPLVSRLEEDEVSLGSDRASPSNELLQLLSAATDVVRLAKCGSSATGTALPSPAPVLPSSFSSIVAFVDTFLRRFGLPSCRSSASFIRAAFGGGTAAAAAGSSDDGHTRQSPSAAVDTWNCGCGTSVVSSESRCIVCEISVLETDAASTTQVRRALTCDVDHAATATAAAPVSHAMRRCPRCLLLTPSASLYCTHCPALHPQYQSILAHSRWTCGFCYQRYPLLLDVSAHEPCHSSQSVPEAERAAQVTVSKRRCCQKPLLAPWHCGSCGQQVPPHHRSCTDCGSLLPFPLPRLPSSHRDETPEGSSTTTKSAAVSAPRVWYCVQCEGLPELTDDGIQILPCAACGANGRTSRYDPHESFSAFAFTWVCGCGTTNSCSRRSCRQCTLSTVGSRQPVPDDPRKEWIDRKEVHYTCVRCSRLVSSENAVHGAMLVAGAVRVLTAACSECGTLHPREDTLLHQRRLVACQHCEAPKPMLPLPTTSASHEAESMCTHCGIGGAVPLDETSDTSESGSLLRIASDAFDVALTTTAIVDLPWKCHNCGERNEVSEDSLRFRTCGSCFVDRPSALLFDPCSTWTCSYCGKEGCTQFSCQRCGNVPPLLQSSVDSLLWRCTACKRANYCWELACSGCRQARPPPEQLSRLSPTSWKCHRCGSHNSTTKSKCYQCHLACPVIARVESSNDSAQREVRKAAREMERGDVRARSEDVDDEVPGEADEHRLAEAERILLEAADESAKRGSATGEADDDELRALLYSSPELSISLPEKLVTTSTATIDSSAALQQALDEVVRSRW